VHRPAFADEFRRAVAVAIANARGRFAQDDAIELLLPDPGVDPQTNFTDVLAKLVNLWPASRLDESHTAGLDRRSIDKLAA
jgi:hypothetical protein